MKHLLDKVLSRTKVESRPYQRRIVTKNVDMFQGRYKGLDSKTEPNARSVLIESPTGSGKTVMGWLSAKLLQEEMLAAGKTLHVGWVAMRRNLLSQAENENRVKGINVENLHMVSMFDSRPESLLEAKKAGHPVLMVVDEAQHDAANSMAHLHNLVEPDFILGLSATPFRTDRVKLCFDKVIKDAGIHALIQDGYLSKFHHYSIPKWTVECVAETYLRDPQRWGKSIFYFKCLQECHELASILRGAGIALEVVTGDSDVETQLSLFRENAIPVLINCMKLTEGFDEPSLQTAWVRDSGKGPTMQMSGRVFRPWKSLPFKQIVQSKQTRWPMLKTAMPTQQFIWQENQWLSLTVNPKINQISHNARVAIASAEVRMPTFLSDKVGKTVKKWKPI